MSEQFLLTLTLNYEAWFWAKMGWPESSVKAPCTWGWSSMVYCYALMQSHLKMMFRPGTWMARMAPVFPEVSFCLHPLCIYAFILTLGLHCLKYIFSWGYTMWEVVQLGQEVCWTTYWTYLAMHPSLYTDCVSFLSLFKGPTWNRNHWWAWNLQEAWLLRLPPSPLGWRIKHQ